MRSRAIIWGLLSGILLSGQARGANSVVVESKTVTTGAQAVEIGVRLTNEVALSALVVPLRIREVTAGSFITRLAMSWGGRLDNVLTDAVINNQYATEDYTCERFGGLGFGDIVARQADSSRAVGPSPEGVMFVRAQIFSGPLQPGTDAAPSMRLVVDVTGTPGTFEVDTTCTIVANHLQFMQAISGGATIGVMPSFTKGTITIVSCGCAHHGDLNGDNVIDVFDSSLLIDYVFLGDPVPPTDPGCPHIDRGDVNCSGADDIFDVIYLNEYLYSSGPAPCNPCACTPYPTNCP